MGKNKTHNSLTILIFALILALPSCLCMYEDEIGLADWYDAPHAIPNSNLPHISITFLLTVS